MDFLVRYICWKWADNQSENRVSIWSPTENRRDSDEFNVIYLIRYQLNRPDLFGGMCHKYQHLSDDCLLVQVKEVIVYNIIFLQQKEWVSKFLRGLYQKLIKCSMWQNTARCGLLRYSRANLFTNDVIYI